MVTQRPWTREGQPQLPPALEPLDEAGAVGEELPAPAAASATVILVPAGATSHHFAPKLSLPWPLVWPGPESPAK